MTTAIKRRRGTTAQHSTFTGLEGEITVDTTKDTVVVHDGSTAGGFALLREDLSNNTNVITTTNTKTLTNKTVDLASNTLTGTTAQFNTALSDGDFATLAGTETLSNKTFSTNPTISSGTANGVAYLNGSKVLTTGSALTFDGTRLGIANSSPAQLLQIGATGADALIRFSSTGLGYDIGRDNASGNFIFNATQAAPYNQFVWQQGGSEQMRLTSTGLGIGTSSPNNKLEIRGSYASQSSTPQFNISRTEETNQGFSILAGGGVTTFNCYEGTNTVYGTYIFNSTKGSTTAERMRIDSSGNVGIGTSSPARKLDVNGNSILRGYATLYGTGQSSTLFLNNTAYEYAIYPDSSNNLIFADWNVAQTRMTLSSSGNLGLGVTPSAWSQGAALEFGYAGSLWYDNTYSTGTVGNTRLGNNYYLNGGFKYLRNGAACFYQQTATGAHLWQTAPSGTAGNAISFTQAMTLDASGNLGIGTTTTSSAKLSVFSGASPNIATLQIGYSGSANYYDANAHIFRNGSQSEGMRIDSSGNLLVGCTNQTGQDSGASVNVGVSFGSGSIVSQRNNAGNLYLSKASGYTSNGFAYFNVNNATVGSITTNGTTVAYNTSSDYRLKENIQTMQNALDVVAQLNPVTYTWKADGSDGQGFIAHELQAVVPDCVTGEKDAVDAEGKPVYQGIDTSFLVATLTKAIQEQQEQINQLKAEVAVLKGV